MKGLYVETLIRAPLDAVWLHTQEPALHERWDLRFSRIEYLPRDDPAEPQRFLYSTRIGFGRTIRGEGESVATRDGSEGERTSSLRFWSEDPGSLIREGSGYWKYVPAGPATRFLTGYDYQTRFGTAGRLLDAAVFRPLLGWATAWSFDRLRLWLERGIPPEVSRRLFLLQAIARGALALLWIYHGLVPKIVFRDPHEVRMLARSGIPVERIGAAILLIGIGEVLLGSAFLSPRTGSAPFLASAGALLLATLAAFAFFPDSATAAFNPITLNVLGIALSAVGLLTTRVSPFGHRSRRRPERRDRS